MRIAVAVLILLAVACAPTETAALEPAETVNARDIWNDYQENETRANKEWKDKKLLISLGRISSIEEGGKVLKDMDSIGFSHIELDFRNDDDVLDLSRGDTVIAVCELRGFQLDTWLEFYRCEWPE